jgi:peptide/nickel transport system ATP-binding protein
VQADRDAAIPLLDVRNLEKAFVSRPFLRSAQETVAARDVSFRLDRGEALALVGESGSGKTTVARLLLRLDSPDRGSIILDGADVLASEPRRASRRYRGRVQMVFQDPFGSLNAVHTVAHHLERPLVLHGRSTHEGARQAALDLLRTVGLEPPEEFIDRHPYELSGGQRQRVAIARALAAEPDLLVADEPTSMLDVSIRMDILNLLARLKRERRLAILLITHDLAGARTLADGILVLFRGRVVEAGPAREVVERPAHPYTRALLASIAGEEGPGTGTRASLTNHSSAAGCPFVARCPEALDICRSVDPEPRPVGAQGVRCHLYSAGGAT